VQGLEKVRVIAVGAFHNLALTEDVILWAWGNNEYGQLGTGDTQPRSQPIRVEGLSDLSLVHFYFNLFYFLIHFQISLSSVSFSSHCPVSLCKDGKPR
jgi:alpha-tubulin suppressor-like RCC1 family protein